MLSDNSKFATKFSRNSFFNSTLLIIICISLLFGGCDQDKKNTAINLPDPKVLMFESKSQLLAKEFEYIGHTEANRTVALKARVQGTLDKINFTEGHKVKKDQLLFKIDPLPYEIAYAQANSALDAKIATMVLAEKDYDRSMKLYNDGSLSKANLDIAIQRKDQAIALVAAAKNDVANASLNLGYTKIKSPFNGIIGESEYSIGNLITLASMPLATLVDTNKIIVRFQIKEKQVLEFLQTTKNKKNNQLDLTIDLLNPETDDVLLNNGVLNYISPNVDKRSASLTAKAKFENKQNIIMPGLYVKIKIYSNEKKEKILIPKSCVTESQSGKYIWIINEESQAERRYLQIDKAKGNFFVVEKGVQDGEYIVIEGIQKLYPGVKVIGKKVSINPKKATVDSMVERANVDSMVEGAK